MLLGVLVGVSPGGFLLFAVVDTLAGGDGEKATLG
ncbi:Na+/citrate or Na+/malate symporter [Sphaerisporangium krabiense]|uniref:Na+/citrate or Na+/malate symporter n=1 Tax=Sphaerisporangium krabiense TaxID=763782 RepID=A0A7W8ZAM9_9ACTN|nr:Na+/citrate or Na+/malate symporter [Sphaerisporangium krabiense]